MMFRIVDRVVESNKLNKAQSSIVAHTLFMAFSLILIIFIMSTMKNIKEDYQDFVGGVEIKEVCQRISAAIERIYDEPDYYSQTNETMCTVDLALPETIADTNYFVDFNGSDIYVRTMENPLLNYTCPTGYNLTFLGSTTGGMTRITRTDYSNGSTTITLSKI